jgi:acetolactate synthase-1/2/3 large subunit
LRLTGAELVVKTLLEHGVTHVFGLPGDTSMALYEAFRKCPGIHHVMVKDERSAAYMAGAFARVTGRPGVCEGPSGGGALYILPGVAEADGSRIPLVCLTTDLPLSSDDRGSLTQLDQTALFAPVTRFTSRVLLAEKLPESIDRAFRHATASRQGAAHLALPESVLAQPVDGATVSRPSAPATAFPAHRYLPPLSDIQRAAALLESSRRPIILCGGGVHASGGHEAVGKFQAWLSIPAVMSINGKGAVDETTVTGLGVVGGNGGKASCNRAARDADLVLVLGSRLNSTTTAGGYICNQDAGVIQVDLDASQIGNAHRVDLALVGDITCVLDALASALRERGVVREGQYRAWADACRHQVEEEIARYEPLLSSPAFPCKPHRVMRALERVVPSESIVVCDAGTPTPYVAAFYRPRASGSWFLAGRCHGSLGFALPAAMGAQFGHPDRPVLALLGDGSLSMGLGELETLVRYRLPIVVLAFRNHAYSWIKCLQNLYYGASYHGVDFSEPVDFCAVARAFGIAAYRPGSGGELEEVLSRAIRERRPAFIEVAVECLTRELPPVHAWQRDAGLPPDLRRRASY